MKDPCGMGDPESVKRAFGPGESENAELQRALDRVSGNGAVKIGIYFEEAKTIAKAYYAELNKRGLAETHRDQYEEEYAKSLKTIGELREKLARAEAVARESNERELDAYERFEKLKAGFREKAEAAAENTAAANVKIKQRLREAEKVIIAAHVHRVEPCFASRTNLKLALEDYEKAILPSQPSTQEGS